MSRPDPAEVPIRDAATVVLLRNSPTGKGIEAWLLTRVVQMAFAAGMSVFPGGRVDDSDIDVPLQGVDVEELAVRFGATPRLAHGLLGAAIRETFEETGVLLTAPAADLADARADVENRRVAFAALLREHGLVADAGAVRPWARWLTPRGEPRRYDTRFFIAALPDGVDAQDVTSESSTASWVPVGLAIEQAQRGERKLMPPTMLTLASLQSYDTVDAALAASEARSLELIEPMLQVEDDGTVTITLPDGTIMTRP